MIMPNVPAVVIVEGVVAVGRGRADIVVAARIVAVDVRLVAAVAVVAVVVVFVRCKPPGRAFQFCVCSLPSH